jgi:hypothetical protein
MLTCNLWKTIHNIWLQHLGKEGLACTLPLLMNMCDLSSKVHCIGSA